MKKEPMPLTQAQEKGLTSMDIAAERRARLREMMPEAFAGDQIDFEQLKRALGEEVYAGKERYGLGWPGKAECMKVIQAPSIATLKPCHEESVNFDATENLFIEGDNLEVLKLLQKAYFGKVKMIYIDPPYNTTNDFIYEDDFTDSLGKYRQQTGQLDESGNLWSTESESKEQKAGRRHTRWLNMMYPRLYLARNLLREDGVIFISIDDNEQANLKALCDLVFGEENFEGHIHWRRRHNQPNDPTKMIGLVAEHILAYAKNKETLKAVGVGKVELTGTFSNPDNDPKGDWASKPWKVGSDQSGSRYKITTPTGAILDEEWMGDESTYKKLLSENRMIFPDKGNGCPRKKYYRFERAEEGQSATNWWSHDLFGSNQEGNKELEEIFSRKNVFSNPKPVKLISQLIAIGNCKDDDIIMDFFAGSGTTADAVMQANIEDGGRRKFVIIQLPERIREDVNEQKTAYEYCQSNGLPFTISALTQERIRRAAKKIAEEQNGKLNLDGTRPLDLGFKVFKLAASNFRIWEGEKALESDDEAEQTATLLRMLEEHVDHLSQASTPEDILYELLLKAGFSLTIPIDKRVMAGKDVYSIEDGAMLICLDKHLDDAVIDAMAATHPIRVICLDEGFQGNDQLKANAVQTFKSRSLHEDNEIVFRTV